MEQTLPSVPQPTKKPTTWKRSLFDALSNALIKGLGLNRPSRLYQALLSKIDVTKVIESNGTKLVFDANKELHLWRAVVFNEKEPDTIEWINSFGRGEILLDVGANVGVFSLYAAGHRDCEVYAFEPESQNYACLNKNIFLNRLSRRIHAFNVGLDQTTSVTQIHLENFQSGAANHSVGAPVNVKGERYDVAFSQTILAYSFDQFRQQFGIPVPHHIKVDVDGNESKVLRGMTQTLKDPTVRSICIELKESDLDLVQFVCDQGFTVTRKTRAGDFTGSSGHEYLSNFVFHRAK